MDVDGPAPGCVIVYITTRDRDEAWTIGRMLVERRLAACANVVPAVDSIYWWDGRLVEDREALLLVKTSRERLEELIAAVVDAHSYEVPAVLAIDVAQGNPRYLAWLLRETAVAAAGEDRSRDGG